MTVYITRLTITNFRSCIHTDLAVSPFTALIGRNNCGKSNCLTAMQWLVRRATLEADDFNNIGQSVEVIGELSGVTEAALAALGDSHRGKIQQHVRDGKLVVRRVQGVPKTSPSLTVVDPATGGWVPNPTGIDQAIQALFPDPIRIGAMDDAAEDASKAKTTTTIGKLLIAMLSAIRDQHEADLVLHLDQITRRLSASGEERYDELSRIDHSINQRVAELFPGVSVRLDFPVPAIEDLIKSGTLRVYEGASGGRPFASYGHGAQRAIQMALVRHLAEVKRAAAPEGGATLLLIDEPELYLHPFAIEQVREALRTLASVAGYQVVFSTHSGQMLLPIDAKNALVMRKSDEGTTARPRLEQVIQEKIDCAEHQLAQLFTLTNSSQVLFADKVVLAEGKTELRLLPEIFRTLSGQSMGQAATALIAQSGANDTRKSMEILDALGIPCCAIVDLDWAFRGGVHGGLLREDDPDISGCVSVLREMAQRGTVEVDDQGLPRKGALGVPAARAFALLAAEPKAQAHISALAEKLRTGRVWLWTRGAVEAHLGLGAKNEKEWLRFQVRCEQEGLESSCADYQGIADLVHWLQTEV